MAMLRMSLTLASIGMVVVSDATADTYLPTDIGWEWTYSGLWEGAPTSDTQRIVGVASVLGREVVVKRSFEGAADLYYSVSPAGDVLFHGAAGVGFSFYLDPPVVEMRGDAVPGDSWVTSSQSYCDPAGEVPFGPVTDYPVDMLDVEMVSVPAGDFVAAKVTILGYQTCAGQWVTSASGRLTTTRGLLGYA
jgi:hypothetical protein